LAIAVLGVVPQPRSFCQVRPGVRPIAISQLGSDDGSQSSVEVCDGIGGYKPAYRTEAAREPNVEVDRITNQKRRGVD